MIPPKTFLTAQYLPPTSVYPGCAGPAAGPNGLYAGAGMWDCCLFLLIFLMELFWQRLAIHAIRASASARLHSVRVAIKRRVCSAISYCFSNATVFAEFIFFSQAWGAAGAAAPRVCPGPNPINSSGTPHALVLFDCHSRFRFTSPAGRDGRTHETGYVALLPASYALFFVTSCECLSGISSAPSLSGSLSDRTSILCRLPVGSDQRPGTLFMFAVARSRSR